MKIFFLLGFIMLGFAIYIISFPTYYSIEEISHRDTLSKISFCEETHLMDSTTKSYSTSIDWSNCDLTGVSLRNYDLSNADLEGVIFSGADLTGANLEGVNLKNSIMYGADLR